MANIMIKTNETKSPLIRTICVLLLLCANGLALGSDSVKPMNVLFLVVDDLNTWLLSNPDRYEGKVVAPNI